MFWQNMLRTVSTFGKLSQNKDKPSVMQPNMEKTNHWCLELGTRKPTVHHKKRKSMFEFAHGSTQTWLLSQPLTTLSTHSQFSAYQWCHKRLYFLSDTVQHQLGMHLEQNWCWSVQNMEQRCKGYLLIAPSTLQFRTTVASTVNGEGKWRESEWDKRMVHLCLPNLKKK